MVRAGPLCQGFAGSALVGREQIAGEQTSLFLLPYQGLPLWAQMIKNPPVAQMWVQSLGREDPQEKKMATHSSTLPWKIPWTEELGRLQSMGSLRVGHD